MREQLNAHPHTCSRDTPLLLVSYSFHFTLKSSYRTCNYFLPRTHRMVLFIPRIFISHGTAYMCVCYLCSILASSSACWHLIYTHQFFSRWLNTAVRRAAQHLANICPSYVAYVGAATLRRAEFVPVYWQLKKFSASHTHAQTQTHKHLSASQLVICAKALGLVGEVSAVIW